VLVGLVFFTRWTEVSDEESGTILNSFISRARQKFGSSAEAPEAADQFRREERKLMVKSGVLNEASFANSPKIVSDSALPEEQKNSALSKEQNNSALIKQRKNPALQQKQQNSALPKEQNKSALTEEQKDSALLEEQNSTKIAVNSPSAEDVKPPSTSPSWSPTLFTKHPTRRYGENWKNGPSLQCEDECCGTHLAQLTRRVMHKSCILNGKIVIADHRPHRSDCTVFQCVQKCMNPGRIKLQYVDPSKVAHIPYVDKTVYVLPATHPNHLWHVLWSLIPGFTMLWKVFGNEMGSKAEVILDAITGREDGLQLREFKDKPANTYPWLSLYRTDFPIKLRLHMPNTCYKDMIYGHPPFWSQHEDEISYENAMFFKNWLVSPHSGADIDQFPWYKFTPPQGVKPVTQFWKTGDRTLPKLLFLRRRKSRFLMDKDGNKNSQDIIDALVKDGQVNVDSLFAEDYSVQDQLAATKGADILMAPHGQGLAWGCWLHDGGVIIEILPMNSDHGWTNYGQSGNFDIVIPFKVSRVVVHGRAFGDPKWQGKAYRMAGSRGQWINSESTRWQDVDVTNVGWRDVNIEITPEEIVETVSIALAFLNSPLTFNYLETTVRNRNGRPASKTSKTRTDVYIRAKKFDGFVSERDKVLNTVDKIHASRRFRQ